MSGDSNIGAWIQFAKLTAAAGEMAPFPYIKGVAGCIASILEVIELAGKNNEDLQDLAESIGTTIRIIKETVQAHGDTSATCFHDVCMELQAYLESLIAEINTTRCNLKSKRITRFLKTKKVSGAIDGYKQRVNNIKADFLVLVTTDARHAISEMRDALSTTVQSQAHCIRGEIRSLGDIQKENVAQICEKLQDLKGDHKGQVRELSQWEIYVGRAVSPWHRFGPVYEDRYCTVESSSSAKIIRVYQHSHHNKEVILKQFNDDADALINIKHPNIAQIFGICRSPNFPAIIFHGTTQISFYDYESNLTAKQFVRFYIQLFYDLESVTEYLSRHYTLPDLGGLVNPSPIQLNEHGQIVMTPTVSNLYGIGVSFVYISDILWNHINLWVSLTREPLLSQINRWSSSLTLQKDNLCNVYDAIKHIIWSKHSSLFHPQNQPYAPGSVLTSSRGTLVGRVQARLDKWEVYWEGHTILSLPSTNNGSVMVPLPYAGTLSYYAEIQSHSFDGILNSWIAQASQLQSCIHSRDHVDDDELLLIDKIHFSLSVIPEERYDPFRLCNTFMAEDHHTLSLLISTPSIDYQTNKVSWQAVFTWFYDGDSEMSSVEVEEVFGVKLSTWEVSWRQPFSKMVLTTIPKLNADYRFNPACGGADVCEYFGWPLMEILDISTGDWMPLNGTVSKLASVNLDDGHCSLSKKTTSSLGNALEGAHVDEVLTEMENATPVQTRDLKMSHGSLVFIVMFTAISTILLSFVIQTYV
ncbi:uncharacterized protein EV420DRAFT_1643365 [Desarmillaria tabescens]|uniref:Protein kinase domain-containing protein n=1 Tax=Armillaria tabescens TaxID=1929756 RepID=A0AA39KC17_ARMTA|nr:uncharacterized protein EV420DRAFT_1643365 [Desarmillaria tabescens]KAK0458018.1 hypothetical protein EV420DRAFT_1643365 [Desarmillaria tabescens]